jgi:hypothetical protein
MDPGMRWDDGTSHVEIALPSPQRKLGPILIFGFLMSSDQSASITPAAPMPVPMHMVTRP